MRKPKFKPLKPHTGHWERVANALATHYVVAVQREVVVNSEHSTQNNECTESY